MARKSTKKVNKDISIEELETANALTSFTDEQVKTIAEVNTEINDSMDIVSPENEEMILVQKPFELNLTQTVGVSGTVAHIDTKDFSQIILLRKVAGLKSGTIIDIIDTDRHGGVHFKIGETEAYLSTYEKDKLWRFYGEK